MAGGASVKITWHTKRRDDAKITGLSAHFECNIHDAFTGSGYEWSVRYRGPRHRCYVDLNGRARTKAHAESSACAALETLRRMVVQYMNAVKS